jgi:hypothetical protein
MGAMFSHHETADAVMATEAQAILPGPRSPAAVSGYLVAASGARGAEVD